MNFSPQNIYYFQLVCFGCYFNCNRNDYFQQDEWFSVCLFWIIRFLKLDIYLSLAAAIIWIYFILFCFTFSSSHTAFCWSVSQTKVNLWWQLNRHLTDLLWHIPFFLVPTNRELNHTIRISKALGLLAELEDRFERNWVSLVIWQESFQNGQTG